MASSEAPLQPSWERFRQGHPEDDLPNSSQLIKDGLAVRYCLAEWSGSRVRDDDQRAPQPLRYLASRLRMQASGVGEGGKPRPAWPHRQEDSGGPAARIAATPADAAGRGARHCRDIPHQATRGQHDGHHLAGAQPDRRSIVSHGEHPMVRRGSLSSRAAAGRVVTGAAGTVMVTPGAAVALPGEAAAVPGEPVVATGPVPQAMSPAPVRPMTTLRTPERALMPLGRQAHALVQTPTGVGGCGLLSGQALSRGYHQRARLAAAAIALVSQQMATALLG